MQRVINNINDRLESVETLLKFPSVDENNTALKRWIKELTYEAMYDQREEDEYAKYKQPEDTRDILLALIDHMGLEYKHNKIVIQKKAKK
jgi:hypothetical protein